MHTELTRLAREFEWRIQDLATQESGSRLWMLHTRTPEASIYSDATWQETDELLDESWWYLTRNQIIKKTLDRSGVHGPIWDIGCGSGVVARFLNDQGLATVGVEPSFGGAQLTSRRGVTAVCGSLEGLVLPDESLEAVAMFDVLEHLKDRDSAIQEIRRVLKPNGHLILTLPALKILWSEFDETGGHYLRYNRSTIRKELESHGFRVRSMGYFFASTVLPLLVLRVLPYRLGRRKAIATESSLGSSGGALGRLASRIEVLLASRVPFGSSLIVVAERHDRMTV